jgi:carbonic anhydrase
MINIKYLILVFFLQGMVSCVDKKEEKNDLEEKVVSEEPISLNESYQGWNYENTNWEKIGNNECSSAVQSPVNINTEDVIEAQLANIIYEYEPFPMQIVDNGYTVQVFGTESSYITVEGKRYQFKQFHFHIPAEHTLDGKVYSMEMHLVHQEVGTNNLVVLGVFIEEATGANPLLEKVFDEIPQEKEQEITTDVNINLEDYIPPSQTHYTYIGSLTTPPCTVGVDWIIFNEPIKASGSQLQKFSRVYAKNSRPVMPLNNRRVFKSINN